MTLEAIEIDNMQANLAILRHCRMKKAEIAELEQNARAAIEAALGDCEAGIIGGRIAVTWKRSTRSAINQKLLRDRFPDVAEQVTTVTEVRRFDFSAGDGE
jgi:predicted phage-related endonuclease